jgi:biotin-(acetyl-CoA carboxylase) ligase
MLAQYIENELQLLKNESALTHNASIFNNLEKYIEQLMSTNFEQFINLLYRLDISEAKIIAYAQSHIIDSKKITTLIIERQFEKIKTRAEYKNYTAGKGTDEELL